MVLEVCEAPPEAVAFHHRASTPPVVQAEPVAPLCPPPVTPTELIRLCTVILMCRTRFGLVILVSPMPENLKWVLIY